MSSGQTISPDSVAPADGARILVLLNAAETAEALAAAIELPNEPDVGFRIAAHLLERRRELGSFTTLHELLTVPGVGPVRFTRIVRALLGDVAGLIKPEDVEVKDAQKILAFLNEAQSAQALADGIELPNEPDIGPRLGGHILDRRTQLGTFTQLEQLLTVELIGPVRFTRIVRAILGRGSVARDEFEDLAAQVAALQEALAAAPPRVVLRSVEPQRYLGQPVGLVATVTRADGAPVGGLPVTLSASWGRLRGSDGFSIQEGGNVTLRTSGDGSVRVTLLPPTSEALQQSQQEAVEALLGVLDPAAPTPHEAEEGLRELVRAYRFDANEDFRGGVDIYFREFHQRRLDSVNYRDELESWPTLDAVVLAYAHQLAEDGQADTGVLSSGALVVHVRDWLGAWLQTHVEVASEETVLAGELAIATGFADPEDILSRIHERVTAYVSLQQGVAGQVIGQKVAEAKLGGFLEAGIDTLPAEKRQVLFPAVDTSTATIAKLGVGALGALDRTRTDLRARVDARLSTGIAEAVEQSPALAGMQAALASKVDKTAFDAAVATKLDVATLRQHLQSAGDFGSFKSSLSNVFNVMIERGDFRLPGG